MSECFYSSGNLNDDKKNTTTTKQHLDASGQQEWARLSEWIHCMCVVTFDLNLGQALEFVYPPQYIPNEQEISNICYMAFPDSNSGCMGDTNFHMRLRITADSRKSLPQTYGRYNNDCIPVLRADQSHYLGFVYFRQKRDANLPRGYFQKSFIVVTRLPFYNLFYEVLTQLATMYFDEGNLILERACHQIDCEWPALQAGITLNLPLFKYCYQINIPKTANRRHIQPIDSRECSKFGDNCISVKETLITRTIESLNEMELFRSLGFVVEDLYTLWELVLTAEPIVVVGTSPADCSHMVQTLTGLISPLQFCAEARPFFTIHDTEFKEFTRKYSKEPPSLLLGVTNPFFIKLFKDWPHMLRLVDIQTNIQQQHQQMFPKNVCNSSSVTSFSSNISLKMKSSSSTNTSISMTSGLNSSSDGSMLGLHTKYKPYLRKDKTLIKKVQHGIKTKRPVHVQTALLRRHLLELTQSFMIPLERYMASLMPLQKDISPFKLAPNANVFKLNDFLDTLELSGPHLTSPLKGDWKGLYRRFFNSPNFRGWHDMRQRELQLTLQDLQLQALTEVNLELWARDKQEVEIIDMILKLKQKLNLYTDKSFGDDGSNGNICYPREQIRAQINCIKELLPHDLKNVVNI